MTCRNKHISSNFDEFLEGEQILDEVIWQSKKLLLIKSNGY